LRSKKAFWSMKAQKERIEKKSYLSEKGREPTGENSETADQASLRGLRPMQKKEEILEKENRVGGKERKLTRVSKEKRMLSPLATNTTKRNERQKKKVEVKKRREK